MKRENFTFSSSDEKTTIHAVKWIPDSGEYKAILQITHGMIEFIERYSDFASFLTNYGFMVVGHDHLGHGESVTDKENWGYIAEDSPSDVMVNDMHKLRTEVQNANKDVPYFMLGHSMGSFMLRKYIMLHNDNLSGVIIMGTGHVPTVVAKTAKDMCSTIALFKGWEHKSKVVERLTFGLPYKKYDLTGEMADNSWLTKDEDIVKAYYSDPKCTFTFSVNAYTALFDTIMFDNRLRNINKIPKNLPLLFVSGNEDPVGNSGRGVKRVHNRYKRVGIKDVTLKLYENDRHEILNEIDRDEVYNDILEWLEDRISAAQYL